MTERFHFDPASVLVAPAPSLLQGLGAAGRPLHVEVGFGKDVRILDAAAGDAHGLYLGVEISRKKCLSFCRKVARAGLENVRAFCGDVRVLLQEMLPPGSVASFTILFPDPWPKRRHRKHRWIQTGTAALVVRALAPGGRVTAATDFADYAESIDEDFRAAGLVRVKKREGMPEAMRTLYSERFERRGLAVTYLEFEKPAG